MNNTNDNNKKDNTKKDNIKEIKLKNKDISLKGNLNSFSKIKQKKKIKDIKVYLNKEPDSEEIQNTEDVHSINIIVIKIFIFLFIILINFIYIFY